ncbi:hypothetical protein KIW84_045109 [Lathyrus oleraceus]|uniref:Reverse transcriptase n=1 Tax=Pisum sativum TaxID=3888 RepID=A0A9D5AWU7_PEA|nr:hypothetical protein KIW84_045109 [Pisum sativum]
MEANIFSSSMPVLVRRSPKDDFKVEHGLRQGDPISPFLSALAYERLACLINKAVCTNKDEVLADVRAWVNGSWKWHFNFKTSDDNAYVAEQSAELTEILKGILLSLGSGDVYSLGK